MGEMLRIINIIADLQNEMLALLLSLRLIVYFIERS